MPHRNTRKRVERSLDRLEGPAAGDIPPNAGDPIMSLSSFSRVVWPDRTPSNHLTDREAQHLEALTGGAAADAAADERTETQ